MDGSGICDISLMRQSFTCSKEAADRLRQSLEIIKTSKKSLMLIEALHCSESSGNHCSSYTDHELHLDTSYLSETDSRLAECLVAAV